MSPIWSPDGSELFFGHMYRTGGDAAEGIYRIPASGGSPTLMLPSELEDQPQSVSPDGRYLLFNRRHSVTRSQDDLWVMPLAPQGEPAALLRTASAYETWPRFSRDGRWIAYVSNESGIDEVYVMPFAMPSEADRDADPPGKWQISNGGASMPAWSHDGTELYFLTHDEMLMAVKVNGDGGQLAPGPAEPLFLMHVGMGNTFDVTPDGNFIATSADETSSQPVALILNWTADLDE